LFAQNGHQVFAGVRNVKSDGAQELLKHAQAEKLNVTLLPLDITKQELVTKAVHQVTKKADRIDVLINNAGFGFIGALEDFTIEEIKEQHETNFYGTIRMIKAVTPHMRTQKTGLIINITSINGLIPFPLYGVYSSSKFALETVSEALRFELFPFGIKVAIVEPGGFLTKFRDKGKHPKNQSNPNSPYFKFTQQFFSRWNQFSDQKSQGILGRLVDPKRVARLLLHISQQKNPKLRHVIGIDAYVYLFLKQILPYSLQFKLLQKVYQWE